MTSSERKFLLRILCLKPFGEREALFIRCQREAERRFRKLHHVVNHFLRPHNLLRPEEVAREAAVAGLTFGGLSQGIKASSERCSNWRGGDTEKWICLGCTAEPSRTPERQSLCGIINTHAQPFAKQRRREEKKQACRLSSTIFPRELSAYAGLLYTLLRRATVIGGSVRIGEKNILCSFCRFSTALKTNADLQRPPISKHE